MLTPFKEGNLKLDLGTKQTCERLYHMFLPTYDFVPNHRIEPVFSTIWNPVVSLLVPIEEEIWDDINF